MPVKAVAAKTAKAVIETGAVGSLRADEAVMIRPEIAGRIEKMPFEEGQRVEKGALLASLDASELRAVVASSKVQAGLDKQRLDRSADLHKKGFISQQALDEARSTYARSAAKVREDEARLPQRGRRAARHAAAQHGAARPRPAPPPRAEHTHARSGRPQSH